MTQDDPLSPTIFSVVVNAVVCHWLEQEEWEEVESSGGKGDGKQTAVRMIRDRDDGRQW